MRPLYKHFYSFKNKQHPRASDFACVPFVHQNPTDPLYRRLCSTSNTDFLCTICVPKSRKPALEVVLRVPKFHDFLFRNRVFLSRFYLHGTQMDVLIHLCTIPFLSHGTQMVHKNNFSSVFSDHICQLLFII